MIIFRGSSHRIFLVLGLSLGAVIGKAQAGLIEVGGGVGANQAYTFSLSGTTSVQEGQDVTLRYLESGATDSLSREGAGSFFARTSETQRLGSEIFYRMEPDQVKGVGIAPSASVRVSDHTRLYPGLEFARYTQARSGGGGRRTTGILSFSASLGVSQDLFSSLSVYGSAAFYHYSEPSRGINFSNRRRPIFMSSLTQLGTFPQNEFSLSLTESFNEDWDATLGASRSKDSSSGVVTVSEWISASYQINYTWGAQLQYTSSNTGTRFGSSSVNY